MHDPMTQSFHVNWPIEFTIWHVDPEKDGTDDSCGWFIRPRHVNKDILSRIEKRFEFDWDRVFTSDSGNTYLCGLFRPDGYPHLSVHGITVNLFFIAATEIFGSYDRALPFMRKHLFEIIFFAENTCDSLYDGITRKFETACREEYDDRKRKERIHDMAGCIYSWISRKTRPWYLHPKWHIHHWKIQVRFFQKIHRWIFARCCKCGKRFKKFGDTNVVGNWDGDRIWHGDCDQTDKPQRVS